MQFASADGLLQGLCWNYLMYSPLLPVTLKQAAAAAE